MCSDTKFLTLSFYPRGNSELTIVESLDRGKEAPFGFLRK